MFKLPFSARRQTFGALNKVSEKAGGLPSSGFFFFPVIATFLAVFRHGKTAPKIRR
jgi:hypothetical protein